MPDSIALIAPEYRNDPLAQEFAEFLSKTLPDWAFELSYAWDCEIPPQAEWQRERDDLLAHLESL